MARYRHEAATALESLVHSGPQQPTFFAATFSADMDGVLLAAQALIFVVPAPLGDDGQPISVAELVSRLSRLQHDAAPNRLH